MKNVILTILVLITGLTAGGIAPDVLAQPTGTQVTEQDQALLQELDFQRFGAYFAFEDAGLGGFITVDITAERLDGTSTATTQVRYGIVDGNFFARIDYIAPAELIGDVFIVTPESVFFFNPDLDEPIVVPGTFEVFGDATVFEVVGVFFLGNYAVTSTEEITLESGQAGLRFELEGLTSNVTYPFATVDVELLDAGDQTFRRPVSLELFGLDRSDPFHLNTFEEYASFNGLPYFKRQLLDNQIVEENQTLLDITTIAHEPISPDTFNPTLLGQDN
jgi:hypothetical protein